MAHLGPDTLGAVDAGGALNGNRGTNLFVRVPGLIQGGLGCYNIDAVSREGLAKSINIIPGGGVTPLNIQAALDDPYRPGTLIPAILSETNPGNLTPAMLEPTNQDVLIPAMWDSVIGAWIQFTAPTYATHLADRNNPVRTPDDQALPPYVIKLRGQNDKVTPFKGTALIPEDVTLFIDLLNLKMTSTNHHRELSLRKLTLKFAQTGCSWEIKCGKDDEAEAEMLERRDAGGQYRADDLLTIGKRLMKQKLPNLAMAADMDAGYYHGTFSPAATHYGAAIDDNARYLFPLVATFFAHLGQLGDDAARAEEELAAAQATNNFAAAQQAQANITAATNALPQHDIDIQAGEGGCQGRLYGTAGSRGSACFAVEGDSYGCFEGLKKGYFKDKRWYSNETPVTSFTDHTTIGHDGLNFLERVKFIGTQLGYLSINTPAAMNLHQTAIDVICEALKHPGLAAAGQIEVNKRLFSIIAQISKLSDQDIPVFIHFMIKFLESLLSPSPLPPLALQKPIDWGIATNYAVAHAIYDTSQPITNLMNIIDNAWPAFVQNHNAAYPMAQIRPDNEMMKRIHKIHTAIVMVSNSNPAAFPLPAQILNFAELPMTNSSTGRIQPLIGGGQKRKSSKRKYHRRKSTRRKSTRRKSSRRKYKRRKSRTRRR